MGVDLVTVRAETGTGSVGLVGGVGFNSVISFVYFSFDTTRNKCQFSPSLRSEGTTTAFDTSSSRSCLILLCENFSPS